MADIDREKFAYAVAGRLEVLELSYRQAQRKFKGLTPGLFAKVKSGTVVSAANMLLLCEHLELNPLDYLVLDAKNPHCTFGKPHKERKSIRTILRNMSDKSGCSTSCQT